MTETENGSLLFFLSLAVSVSPHRMLTQKTTRLEPKQPEICWISSCSSSIVDKQISRENCQAKWRLALSNKCARTMTRSSRKTHQLETCTAQSQL
jgi:hypothetical protein